MPDLDKMDNRKCASCKWWNCENPTNRPNPLGLCTNPTVPAGRSCTGDMMCNGHEYKVLIPNEQFPLMQNGQQADDSNKVQGLRIKTVTREKVFFPGDIVKLTLIDSYQIHSIIGKNLWVVPLDPKGQPKSRPVLHSVGQHVLERDFELTEQLTGERYGSGACIPAQRDQNGSETDFDGRYPGGGFGGQTSQDGQG